MDDDARTREIVESLSVQPESPRFFDELSALAQRREREATRRWRHAALALGVVALAAIAATGVIAATSAGSANATDLTLQCRSAIKGGLPVFDVFAAPGGAPVIEPGGSVQKPPPGFHAVESLFYRTGDALTLLLFSSGAVGYQLDRSRCLPVRTKLRLAPQGLPKTLSLTAGDAEKYGRRCVGVARTILRIRIAYDSHGVPLRAQLLVVRATSRRPLVFVAWSRAHVDGYNAPFCTPYT